MRGRIVLLGVLGVALLLGGCRGDAARPEQPAETFQPPARSELQRAYSLLDELLLSSAPSALPSGFSLADIGIRGYSLAPVPVQPALRPYGVVAVIIVPLRGPSPYDFLAYAVAASVAEAERLHAAMPGLGGIALTSRLDPPALQYPAACLTGATTVEGRAVNPTDCRVLVGQVEVIAQSYVATGAERGSDQAARALAELGVRHLEAVQRALAERAALRPAARVRRVGWLGPSTFSQGGAFRHTFLKRLEALGYVRDQSLLMEYRFADDRLERLPDLAAELVTAGVDVIVAEGVDAARAAKGATTHLPIVVIGSGEPVQNGLAPSATRPGGNLTGVTLDTSAQIFGKHLEILNDAFPDRKRVAVLIETSSRDGWTDVEQVAWARGLELMPVEVSSLGELPATLEKIGQSGVEAVLEYGSLGAAEFQPIIAFQRKYRLPVMYSGFSDSGPVSYVPSGQEMFRLGGDYVNRVLKGDDPGTLPFQRTSEYELFVSLRFARELGLTVHPALVARATEVEE